MLHWKILERNLKNMLYVLAEDALAPPSTELPLQLALSHLQKSLILIQSSIPQNHFFHSAISDGDFGKYFHLPVSVNFGKWILFTGKLPVNQKNQLTSLKS
jgi:hypothetical protein